MALLVAGDHRARHRGAADEHPLHLREVPLVRVRVEHLEHPEPDRRHAGRPRHALLDEVVEQALRVEVRPGKDELRADHRGEVRIAPRVRVEHRHDGEQRVLLRHAQPERRERRDAERVQDRRAVRVDDALRATGRAARVTHRRGVVLVELRVAPLVGVGRREQLLVRVVDHDHVLDVRAALERVEQRQQALVDDHGLVAAVLRDVADVVVVQAQVQRVQDEAAAGDAEVGLHVLVVVPAERRDAVALLQAELVERHGELLRALRHVAIRVAVEALVRKPRDDLLVAEVRLGAPQERRKRQLEVHHLALHHDLLVSRAGKRRPSRAVHAGSRRTPGSRVRACNTCAARAPR